MLHHISISHGMMCVPASARPQEPCPCYGQHRQTDRQTDRQTHTHTPARALAPARTRAQTHGQEPESSANYRERQHSTQRHTLVGVTLRPLRLETVVWRQVRFSHCVAKPEIARVHPAAHSCEILVNVAKTCRQRVHLHLHSIDCSVCLLRRWVGEGISSNGCRLPFRHAMLCSAKNLEPEHVQR